MRNPGFLKLVYLLIIFGFAIVTTNTTYALSRADQTRQALDGTWSYFDPFDKLGVCTSVEADANLVGDNNAAKIYNYLTANGLSPAQAAGIMGNLKQESGYDPTANEKGTEGPNGIGGYGIAQWTGSRRVALFNSLGSDVNSLAAQLKYLVDESKDRIAVYPGVLSGQNEWEGLKQIPSPDGLNSIEGINALADSVIYWEKNFERAGIPVLGQRLAYAEEELARFGGSTGSSSGSVSDCVDSGTVVGSFSMPVDQIYFDQHPEWFTKPHHSGQVAADIPVPCGVNIYSITSGKIVLAPLDSDPDSWSYGKGVKVDAGNGISLIYAHGQDGGSIPGSQQGDSVKPGQLLFHNGNTGRSFGCHLHLEIRVDNVRVCPQPFLYALGSGNPLPDFKDLPRSGCTY